MRKDYEYIDGVVSLVLSTTSKGDETAKMLVESEQFDSHLGELLWHLQEVAVEIDSESPMPEWFESLKIRYEENCACKYDGTFEEFVKAFAEGYVSIKKYIVG